GAVLVRGAALLEVAAQPEVAVGDGHQRLDARHVALREAPLDQTPRLHRVVVLREVHRFASLHLLPDSWRSASGAAARGRAAMYRCARAVARSPAQPAARCPEHTG